MVSCKLHLVHSCTAKPEYQIYRDRAQILVEIHLSVSKT